MKSPIKDIATKTNSGTLLKQMMPVGALISSYLFYAGQTEFNLSFANRFVHAHTNKVPVYEFWKCMQLDNERIHAIVSSDIFKFQHPKMFTILQESWAEYDDPFVRASLFFLLNSCSEKGKVSSGELNTHNYNPVSLSYIKAFKNLPTFHLSLDTEGEWMDSLEEGDEDYIYIPGGHFSYNLFEHGKSRGHEETLVHHRHLADKLATFTTPWVIVYQSHPAIAQVFHRANLQMIDRYGRLTDNIDRATETIVSNF